MKNLIILLVIHFNLNAQYLWQISSDKIVRWSYIDGDEFNKNTVNKDKWLTKLPWSNAVLSQDIYYLEKNIKFENGNIQFILNKENNLYPLQSWEMDTILFKKNKITLTDGNKFPFKYTGGLLYTKKEYKYGYFEIRFKASEGQGIWPAFWLFGAKPNNEIDFFELKGEKENELHVDIHCPDGCGNFKEGPLGYYRKGWGHWIKTNQKFKDSYNIISGEWTKNYIKWYLNGELIAYSNHSYDLGMNLTAGTGIGKDNGAFGPGSNKETPFPNYFNVDYIRVYKTDTLPSYDEIKNNLGNSENLVHPKTENDYKIKKAKNKLTNNPDKKLNQNRIITLSVIQLTKTNLSIRILGVTSKDKVNIQIKVNNDTEVISEMQLDQNNELIVPIPENKNLTLHAVINNQKITELLFFQ